MSNEEALPVSTMYLMPLRWKKASNVCEMLSGRFSPMTSCTPMISAATASEPTVHPVRSASGAGPLAARRRTSCRAVPTMIATAPAAADTLRSDQSMPNRPNTIATSETNATLMAGAVAHSVNLRAPSARPSARPGA